MKNEGDRRDMNEGFDYRNEYQDSLQHALTTSQTVQLCENQSKIIPIKSSKDQN